MALPSLVVRLGLDAAEFVNGLTRAEAQSKKFNRSLDTSARATNSLRNALRGLTAGITVGAFAGLVKASIDSADKLNDLSKFTGIAATTLGGVGFAAKQAGSDLEGAAKAFGKFNITIGEANSGNKDAIATLRALTITAADLNNLKADDLLVKAADAFASFEDGADKATLGNRAFKKSYAEIASLLDEGGASLRKNIEFFQKYSGITAEVVRKSDEFNDELAKFGLIISGIVRSVTAELLPVFKDIVDVLVKVGKESRDTKSAIGGIASDSSLKTWAQDITITLAEVGEALIFIAKSVRSVGGSFQVVGADLAVIKQSFKGFTPQDLLSGKALEDMRAVLAEREKILSDANNRYSKLVDDEANTLSSSLREQFAKSNAVIGQAAAQSAAAIAAFGDPILKTKRPAPRIPDGAGGAKDDPARKQLDAQLKALERIISEEQDVLQERLHFLQEYYATDKLGITEYFASRREVTQDALKVMVGALDEEQRILKARLSTGGLEANERIALEDKLLVAIDKKNKVQRQGSFEGSKGWIDERAAAKSFLLQVEDISIALAEMREDPFAGRARFDFANRELQERLAAQRNSSDDATRRAAEIGLRDLAITRARVGTQDDLTKSSERFSDTLDDLALAQARINIAETSGAITGLEALRKRSDATKERLGQLRAELEAVVAIANAAGTPISRQDRKNIENLKLQLEELEAQGDLVAKKFNDIFADSFSNAFGEFISGTKSAKDAFKDFAKSVTQQINQIASRNIADALFGKDKALSGIGDFFSGIFGGGGKAATKGADPAAQAATALAASTTTSAASIAALGTATSATVLAFPTLDVGLSSLALAAETAATALLSIGKDAGSFTDLLSAPKAATPALSDADAASLLGLSTAAKSTTAALGSVTSASTAMDVALTPLQVGFANLNTSAGSVAGTLITTGKHAGLFADFLGKAANAPEFSVDTSALLGLNTAAASTTSALATVASASAATKSAMAPLTAGFAGLNTSAQSVASALRTTGKDVLSDLSNAIVVDTSAFDKSLLGLNTAAAGTTSALAAVASSSAATDLAMTPLMAGFAGLSTSADTVANVLLTTGKDAGLFADFLSKAASSPDIVVDTSQLLGLNAAATGTTSALASVANVSAATELAMTPLRAGFVNLSTSAETFAASLLATGKDAFTDFSKVTAPTALSGADVSSLLGLSTAAKSTTTALAAVSSASTAADIALTPLTSGFSNLSTSADVMASAFRLTGKDLVADLSNAIVIDPAAFDKSLVGINGAAASTSSALASVASASSATNLAMTPLQAGFSALNTSATNFASSLVASSKDALASLTAAVPVVPSIVTPDAGLLALNASATTTAAALTTVATTSVAMELAMVPLSVGFIGLTAAAQSAALALISISASKAPALVADIFAGLAKGGGLAEGGNPPLNKWSLVGERGPELFMPKVAGTIVPNERLTQGGPVTSNVFHINVLPGATRQSADQAAVAVGREVARATARKA